MNTVVKLQLVINYHTKIYVNTHKRQQFLTQTVMAACSIAAQSKCTRPKRITAQSSELNINFEMQLSDEVHLCLSEEKKQQKQIHQHIVLNTASKVCSNLWRFWICRRQRKYDSHIPGNARDQTLYREGHYRQLHQGYLKANHRKPSTLYQQESLLSRQPVDRERPNIEYSAQGESGKPHQMSC